MVKTPPFILASASPARRQLLQSAGISVFAHPSHFDESQIALTEPAEYVQILAQRKAETVQSQFQDALILGCDSVLVFAGEIMGKPESAEVAIARWQQMRGGVGYLYTGHALLDKGQQRQIVRYAMTEVHFINASDREIQAYVATGEPLRCAGGFAIDGRGGLLIEKLVGCHTNVIGLSLPLLREMLAELGYAIADFWSGEALP